ncbi:MAG: AAA family ATPase [Rikenellaceae bacterium]|nr:AAA family ATPase [Rikenellaceae bacterium]
MKIEVIRGRNLASLEGDFEIDFTAEPLRSAGIYTITGRTGSGKSTILDAVCLALFDQTPRGRIGENVKVYDGISLRDGRMIMRKGCADCYAEVDFVSLGGERYRARWSCRRARGRIDGALRDSETTLRNLTDERDEPGRKREILARISELIGLTFDQFTRAVMLAQGDFATFLRAGQKEKAELLEKLTGTDIYSRISAAIYQHCRTTEQELHILDEQMRDITLLADEQSEALASEERETVSAIEAINKNRSLAAEKLRWIERRRGLDAEIADAQKELTTATEAVAGAAERYRLIERIESVQEIRDPFNMLRQAHEQLRAGEEAIRDNDTAMRNIEAEMPSAAEKERRCAEASEAREKECERLKPEIDEARTADNDIKVAREVLQGKTAMLATLKKRLADGERRTNETIDKIKAFAVKDADTTTNAPLPPRYGETVEGLHDGIDTLRGLLSEGVPCPVCGNTHHSDRHSDKMLNDLVADERRHLEEQRAEIAAQEEEIARSRSRLEELIAKRAGMLDGASVADKEREMTAARSKAENALREAKERHTALKSQAEATGKIASHLRQEHDTLGKRHAALSAQVSAWIEERGITKREITDLLSHDSRWLAREKMELDAMRARVTSAQATLSERHRTLAQHLDSPSRPAPEDTEERLGELLKSEEERFQSLDRRRTEIAVALTTDRQNRERMEATSQKAEKLRAVSEDWRRLNELFGSATGDKFKSIAQGYTLETLLSFSNIHLSELTSRYRLRRIPDTLLLEVTDRDMLDQTRPVNSLSGGESFLVSLSLALGLSSLSGGEMKVESLFIDEGFGSLDADTMRTAIDALERLQVSGRKIGVISHVPELSERIAVRIKVLPGPTGGSHVEIEG